LTAGLALEPAAAVVIGRLAAGRRLLLAGLVLAGLVLAGLVLAATLAAAVAAHAAVRAALPCTRGETQGLVIGRHTRGRASAHAIGSTRDLAFLLTPGDQIVRALRRALPRAAGLALERLGARTLRHARGRAVGHARDQHGVGLTNLVALRLLHNLTGLENLGGRATRIFGLGHPCPRQAGDEHGGD